MNTANPAAPVIAVPATLDDDFVERLYGLRNAQIVEHADHPFIDVGEKTLVHLIDAGAVMDCLTSAVLVDTLKDLLSRSEYPVLMVVGNLFGGGDRNNNSRHRCIAGLIAYLELFTRVRLLQVPSRHHATMMLQLLAKQAQNGFHSLGLEDL